MMNHEVQSTHGSVSMTYHAGTGLQDVDLIVALKASASAATLPTANPTILLDGYTMFDSTIMFD